MKSEIKSQSQRRRRAQKSPRRSEPAVTLDDAMAEAARKILLAHWQRMLAYEQGAQEGSDIEAVHDMRVATRRMRAALRVFTDYLDAEAFKPFAKKLRRTARVLGAVRDLDVFREKTQRYIDTLPAERQSELDSLLTAWQMEYKNKRSALNRLFASEAFARFKHDLTEFLQMPGASTLPTEKPGGMLIVYHVRDVLPVILLRGYADVRVFAASVAQPDVTPAHLHQLRIASKRLRYTLEFFADVMQPEAKLLIDEVKRLQDHLGDLQDAVVACNHLQDFLTFGKWSNVDKRALRRQQTSAVAPGIADYFAVRQAEIHELVQTFPHVWSPIIHPDFKRQLLALIAAFE